MSCSCVCVDYGGPYAEFYTESMVKAKKKHKCCECGKEIEPGETYEKITGKWDSFIETYRTCKNCLNIKEVFFCEGWLFEGMKEALYEHLQDILYYGEFPGECLVKLESGAREYVCEMIEKIWEDMNEEE